MDDEVFALIERAIRESHGDKNKERLETVGRLRGEADRLQQRLDKLYVDHLDGRITADMHDRMAASWREERAGCPRRMDRSEERRVGKECVRTGRYRGGP